MIKKKIFGNDPKAQLKASARDRLMSFLLADGMVRGALLNSTKMVNEMRANHELGILETLVLGHAYTASGLLSANLKGTDRMALQIDCSGPIKGLSVETNAFNEVRGYLKRVPIPIGKPLEDFNLAPFFGAGFISVIKYLEDAKQPFTGKAMLEYGSMAKDLAAYFLNSEQTPTAFNLSVLFDRDGHVTGAGGLFLQAMPGADDAITAGLEDLVKGLPSLGECFSRQEAHEEIISDTFGAYNPQMLSSRRVEFLCRCSVQGIENVLHLLPLEELKEIRDNGPFPVEIRCHHCNTLYEFDKDHIEKIFKEKCQNLH
jgi:molecular chaperone Hsp33